MKLVYILGGNYDANGMCSIITQKLNWLAQRNPEWEIHALLTESKKGRDYYYPLNENIIIDNFELNFDELDTLSQVRKIMPYRANQKQYKRLMTDYLMKLRPDIVVSAMRREINFLTGINDGSIKVGELHFCRQTYRVFSNPKILSSVCRCITRYWQNQLMKQIKKLDAFVVLTEQDSQAWGKLRNMHVIPNFIANMPKQISTCVTKRIVAVGRYTWQKGFDLLLKVWQQVEMSAPDWTLDIYGAGDRSTYLQMADDMHLHHVEMHGATKSINDVFEQSSCLVFSSRYEGFGMVLIEAMACGIPAVSFVCPCGPKDIIQDGRNGYLVPEEDVDAMAMKLLQIIQNEEQRKQMGRHARQDMQAFLRENIMLRWQALFDNLMKN